MVRGLILVIAIVGLALFALAALWSFGVPLADGEAGLVGQFR